jgi:hypothetical protein
MRAKYTDDGVMVQTLHKFCIAFCLALSFVSAYAQDQAEPAAVEPAGPFVIRSLDFQVQGRTRAFALAQKLEADGPVVGRIFADRAALDSFVADKRQILVNNRVLASARAHVDFQPNEGGGSDVALLFIVADTQNLIVLPEPKYDSNTGLTLYLKGRDYDFFGTMQTLELNLSYVNETVNNRYFEAATDFSLPFRAFDADWSFGFFEDAGLWTTGTAKSSSAASITYVIPGLGFPARIKAIQGLYYNDDLPNTTIGQDPLYESDPWYLSESIAAQAIVPLGILLGPFGALSLTPKLGLTENWWPNTKLLYLNRRGPALAIEGDLNAGRVDWDGNMQRGAVFFASVANTYYAASSDTVADLELKLEGHWAWGRKVGLSARLVALDRFLGHFPADDMTDLGVYLRGVIDARAQGAAGAFINVSVPVKLFDFPTHVFLRKDWLDFEFQAAPFVDAAITVPDWSSAASSSRFWGTGGLEFLIFPKAFRSFILRASVGWDLATVARTGSLTALTSDGYKPYEIFIGTDLFTDPILTPRETWIEN